VFYGMDMGKSILHVPASAINQYKATEPWSKFGTIVILEDDTEVYAYIDGIFYSLSNNRATVTYGVPKYSGSVVIPESISFYNKTYPVTTIGNSAFRDCTDLTAVTIPKSVTSLGESVFRGCDSLTDIVVAQGNSIYDSRENCNAIIETNSNMLVVGCRNTTIPSSVKAIRGQAFYGYTGLTHITIPDNVNTIGHKAFGDCTGLTSVTIGKGVNYIDDAFAGCTSLASVTLESNAFVSATKTSSTSMKAVFGEQVMEYIIGNEVEQIGNYAFYGCSNLPSIIIPESVTSIGNHAFSGCRSLTSVTIGNSVASIGNYAFYGCNGLTAITIPENVTSIGSQAFIGCKLHNILVKGETPPSFTSDPFSQNMYNHTSLYIPYGSWDDYIFGSNWYKFINIRETARAGEQVSLQQAYMLMDAETFAYFVYDPVSDGIVSISSSSKIDGDNPNHSWLAEQIDGQMCLYNVGAGKFAVPTSDGSLTLSSALAIIEVENGEGGILFDGKTEHQWAFVCNDRMNAEAIITGIKDSKDFKDFVDSWHSLDGRRLSAPQKGINIVHYSDGTTRKVLVK